MFRADLHMHTKYSSDGELSPAELIARCHASQLTDIAVTDHNTVAAVDETMALGAIRGIRVIPGIEIDCTCQQTDMHLLGYGIRWNDAIYKRLEDKISGMIMDSLDQMIHNLHGLGIPVDQNEVVEKAEGRLPSAELIAEVLLGNPRYDPISQLDPYRKNGSRSDMPFINFYLDFFAQGKPAYVKIEFMPLREAIRIIKETGGIPVVAHPGHNFKGREYVVSELIEEGAEGIEVYNNYHSMEQISFLTELALRKQIWMTAGSDFHGITKPLIQPGQYKYVPGNDTQVQEHLKPFIERFHS